MMLGPFPLHPTWDVKVVKTNVAKLSMSPFQSHEFPRFMCCRNGVKNMKLRFHPLRGSVVKFIQFLPSSRTFIEFRSG